MRRGRAVEPRPYSKCDGKMLMHFEKEMQMFIVASGGKSLGSAGVGVERSVNTASGQDLPE